jgi:hypothetical protein
MAHADCMLDIYGYTHTHTHARTHTLKICNIYSVSTSTMVVRTPLNVTLYVHCLSFSVLNLLLHQANNCFKRLILIIMNSVQLLFLHMYLYYNLCCIFSAYHLSTDPVYLKIVGRKLDRIVTLIATRTGLSFWRIWH